MQLTPILFFLCRTCEIGMGISWSNNSNRTRRRNTYFHPHPHLPPPYYYPPPLLPPPPPPHQYYPNGYTANSVMLHHVPPPPYVDSPTTKKIKNDVNLHKHTLRLHRDPNNPDRHLISFDFDALYHGRYLFPLPFFLCFLFWLWALLTVF